MQASCFIFSCLRVFVFFPSGLTVQTANLDHSLRYRDISLQNQKDSGEGLACVPASQG
jgi:hypothetical protein